MVDEDVAPPIVLALAYIFPGVIRNREKRSDCNAGRLLWSGQADDATACVEQDSATTYLGLRQRAAGYASTLADLSIQPGDRVGVFLERSSEAIAAYFGVLATGGIAVVLNEALRPRQVEAALADCDASVLVTDRNLLARQHRTLKWSAPVVDTTEVRTEAPFKPIPRDEADPAQIIYTSGSSGLPKGVLLSHGNLTANVRIVSTYLGLLDSDRTISLLPFSSVYGLNQLLCTIGTGGTLVIERSPLASRIALTAREQRVTVLAAVPPLWLQLLQAPEFGARPIPTLRVLQSAGGHLPVSAVRAVRAAQPQARLFIMYGMTEVMRSTYLPPEEVDLKPNSIGRAMPESHVHVLRPDGGECDVEEVGELVHAGPTVALGYWGNPEATTNTFGRIGDPPMRAVFSGDMVRRDADGYLYFVSRRDRMIKSLGYRIGPDEITDVLITSGQVEEAVITTEPDEARGERIIAHVVIRDGGSVERLTQFCRVEMPRWLQPSRFEVHARLPRTTGGKYDVLALQKPSNRSPDER